MCRLLPPALGQALALSTHRVGKAVTHQRRRRSRASTHKEDGPTACSRAAPATAQRAAAAGVLSESPRPPHRARRRGRCAQCARWRPADS
eukprot:scaffold4126_cov383-Prasinococcus_capsulatus_cf.AAC.9